MSKKSDDSIERIFRQALTQYDTTFREDDWLKMEKMLKEEANRRAAARSKRIKGTAYTVTGLTGLIIAVYFLAFKTPSSSIAKLNDSPIELQASEDLGKSEGMNNAEGSDGLLSVPVPPDSLANQNANSPGPRNDHEAKPKDAEAPGSKTGVEQRRDEKLMNAYKSKGHNVEKLSSNERKKQNETGESEQSRSSNASERESMRQPLAQTLPSKAVNTNDKQVPPYSEVKQDGNARLKGDDAQNAQLKRDVTANQQTDENFVNTTGDNGNSDTNVRDSAQVTSTGAQPTFNDTESLPDPNQGLSPGTLNTVTPDTLQAGEIISTDEKADSTNATDAHAQQEQASKPAFRWSVGIVFSPEFSTTSLNSYSAPGESVGLRIGYQMSDRFTISTGLIRSNKKYVGKGTDYSPRNPAYWQIRTNGVVPDEIDSKCLVYELPVGLQFDAIQTQKSRLFLSAAISSYFMTSQAYDYTFDDPNPGADTGWRSSGSESYWFNIGVVSAGYERYITRSLALGIEPYLKVSLAEIGWPEIKLFSTGAYVTLRYRFHERRDIE
jgi:hypothetical protein